MMKAVLNSFPNMSNYTIHEAISAGITHLLVEQLFPAIVDLSIKKKGPLSLNDLTESLVIIKALESNGVKPKVKAPPKPKEKPAEGVKTCPYTPTRGKEPGKPCGAPVADGYGHCANCIKHKVSVRKLEGLPPKASNKKTTKGEEVKAPVANVEEVVSSPVEAKSEETNLEAEFFGPEGANLFLLKDINLIGLAVPDSPSCILASLSEDPTTKVRKVLPLSESQKGMADHYNLPIIDNGVEELKKILKGKEYESLF